MKVRSRLACATGLGLLLLLGVFYIGGRMVVVGTLRQASRHLLHAVPRLRGSVRAELEQIQDIAQNAALAAALRGLADDGASNQWDAAALERFGVDLLAVADSGGRLLCALVGDGVEGRPSLLQIEDLRGMLRPGSVLISAPAAEHVRAPEHASVRSGLVLLSGMPMLVAAAPIAAAPGADTGTPKSYPAAAPPPQSYLLAGRSIANVEVMRRITAGLPLESSIQQTAEQVFRPAVSARVGEVVGSSVLYDMPAFWNADEPMRARLPFFDIYGRQVFSLTLSLGYSFMHLAEMSVAWLTFFVACVGVLFIIPMFLVQGHAVLNPLTRLADTLQAFGKGIPKGRRIGWKRRDEFGVVASTIDQMLEAIDAEHQALQFSNNHMRALLAASPDLIVVIDRQGTLVEITNHSRGALVGLFPSLKVGDNIRQAPNTATEDINSFLRRCAEVLDTDRIQIFESGIRRVQGGLSWVEFRMVRLDSDRLLIMIRDVTARRRAQHERARIEEKMSQMQKTESLGVLARGIAHDFNNILTAMLGHVEISMREPLTPPVREAVENIRLAMIRASALTRQMLSYAGQGTFTFEITDLNALLRDLVGLMRSSLSPQAELILDFGASVPLVEADATQIWQVVMNLLVNASDAMASLSGTITLATSHATPAADDMDNYLSTVPLLPGDYAMIEVCDTGHGMDKRTLDRIYDPFFTTKAMGRGLGLSACLGIIRAHNGGIAVSSTSGEGTRFRILLPAARDEQGRVRFPTPDASGLKSAAPDHDRPCPTASEPGSSAASSPSHSGFAAQKSPSDTPGSSRGSILVADDDPAILKLVGIILVDKGFTVIAAENGTEALRLFDKHPERIRLALVDATMNGGLTGLEVCNALHQRNPNLPTIVMSGFREKDVGLDFTENSFSIFLPKPFMSAELIAVVDKAFQNSAVGNSAAASATGGKPYGALR